MGQPRGEVLVLAGQDVELVELGVVLLDHALGGLGVGGGGWR